MLGYILSAGLFLYVFIGVDCTLSSQGHDHVNYNKFVESGRVFGPVIVPAENCDHLSFDQVTGTFAKNINLSKIKNYHREDFKGMIMLKLPKLMKKRLANYIDNVLNFSKRYNLDPFWALSIMWTESHFNQKARSIVGATGLMQIMPKTGHFLGLSMHRPVSFKIAQAYLKDPTLNIEMGIYYLRHLLDFFKGDYKLATVAYNMGPYWVKKRLKFNRPVGVKNEYLDKVRKSYKLITNHFRKQSLVKEYVKSSSKNQSTQYL